MYLDSGFLSKLKYSLVLDFGEKNLTLSFTEDGIQDTRIIKVYVANDTIFSLKDVLEANALVDSLKPVTVDEWNSETERLKNLKKNSTI